MRRIGWLIYMVLMFIASYSISTIAIAQENLSCTGFNSRLAVGMTAWITPGGASNNVRSAAGTSASRIGQLPPGSSFEILDGPHCVDGYTWWQVDYDGLIGWTVEGTPDEYWLEPFEAAASGGRIRNASATPNDLLTAISFFTGAGGGPGVISTTCYAYDIPFDSEIEPVLESYLQSEIAAFTDNDYVNYPSDSELVVEYVEAETDLAHTPSICTSLDIDASDVTLIDPDGEVSAYQAIVYEFEHIDYSQILLPLEAYQHFGVWTMQVNDFILLIDIQPPDNGTVLRIDQHDAPIDDRRLLTGFSPDTEVAVLLTAYDEFGQSHYTITTTTDENGTALITLSETRYWSAIVPSDGENVLVSHAEVNIRGFGVPYSHSGQMLHDAIWNNVDPNTWTCPDALPIRLESYTTARILVDGLKAYDAPSLDGNVVGEYTIGQRISPEYGVECGDGAVWWSIYDESLSTYYRWIPESANGEYLLEPA